MSLGFRIPYSDEKERMCAELLSLILSDPIMSERIPYEIRQKRGLAYNVGGFVSQYKKMCTLGIVCSSTAQNIEEIIKIMLNEIIHARENGITLDELNRAKMNLVTRRNIDFSEPMKRVLYLGKHSTYGRIYSFEDEVRKAKKTSLDFVNKTAGRFFCIENMGLALIGKVDIERVVDILVL